jgi:sec-independent protein translocase protein TatC
MRALFRRIWKLVTAPIRAILWLIRRIVGWFRHMAADIRSFLTEEPEDTPIPDAFSKAVESPGDILDHLDALRKHLLRASIVLLITTAFSFIFARRIMILLAHPLPGGFESLKAIDVTEPLGSFMRISLLAGFAIALPYIILELWLFAAPGLSRKSRLVGLLAIPTITFFFLAGMLFAYFVMLPTALPFLVDFMGIRTEPRPSSYFPFVTSLMFWVGMVFQFPLVIFFLASLGIVQASFLLRYARLAIVILAVVAAMITPTIDPISMLLIWTPLVALYFLGIGLALLAQRGRKRASETQAPSQSAQTR